MKPKSVAEIDGEWAGDIISGLAQRCHDAWKTPLPQLSDLMVATFLSQDIARDAMIIEANRRLSDMPRDDSEIYDGQLEEALAHAIKPEISE
jgi:hypothetical protein